MVTTRTILYLVLRGSPFPNLFIFYFSLFRRFCNHLYLQALTAWRNQQNHESLATVALSERKMKMHTLSYCPFRNGIRNFRDHHSSKRSINLIDPIYILTLSSKHAKTSSNEEKKSFKYSFKGRDRSENQVAHFSFLFREKVRLSKTILSS